MEYTPGKGHYKLHGYLGSKQIATVTQTKPNLDMDRDGRSDASEIGQNPGNVATTHKLEFVNTDVAGSPIVASSFDQRYASQPYNSQQGKRAWTQNYFPYGERREKWSANNGKDHTEWFAGKTLDTETGLSYFGARYYDPAIGRFMGVDPIQANPNKIHSLNRYAYANNNPYANVDPDGRIVVTAIVVAAIAYSAYEGYQEGGAMGALAEASGANDAIDAYNAIRAGDYTGAAIAAVGTVCKACKGAKAVAKYEVGNFDDLKKRSVGDSMDVHHVIQKHPGSQAIVGYNPKTAPSIVVPNREHRRIPTLKGTYNGTARDLLAKDIRDLRNHTSAPNSALRDLIKLNKETYPGVFGK